MGSDKRKDRLKQIRSNSRHGLSDADKITLALSPRDPVHCILKLREKFPFPKKIPWEQVSEVMGITDEKAREFYEERAKANYKRDKNSKWKRRIEVED